uniref:Uncharacterized protein n=1 Tax=Rhizophora mucronata TaxID=61149 RepID=A0A2P2QI17_RHIMU
MKIMTLKNKTFSPFCHVKMRA